MQNRRLTLEGSAVLADAGAANYEEIFRERGGGYLQRYLPAGTRWHGHEPCASFQHNATAADSGLLPPSPALV